jgi:outer membrane lipoprotein-sorting protein
MRFRRPSTVILLALSLFPATGCLFRSHRVEPRVTGASLRETTKDELIQRINLEASKIRTLDATVDISVSVGGAKKGKVTEYHDIRGYLLVREPDQLRLIGLFPVVRNRLFDMVSDGKEFKLSIPPQNKFIVGSNDVTQPTTASLENLRPQAIFDALLLHEIDAQNEIAVLESGTEDVIDPKTRKTFEQPDYMIDVIRRGDKDWYLSRKIVFSRVDLQPHRQTVYDKSGNVATDTRYENFRDFGGLNFPSVIHITRPQEEYDIVLTLVKLQANVNLRDDQFALQQPPGSTLVRLGTGQSLSSSDGNSQNGNRPK